MNSNRGGSSSHTDRCRTHVVGTRCALLTVNTLWAVLIRIYRKNMEMHLVRAH